MADQNLSEPDPLQEANEKIRGAAKWLIGSSAAVGAALIAGSQLSSIGKLDVGDSRFLWAVGGAALGLSGVIAAIWIAVRILVPVTVTINQIATEWNMEKEPGKIDFRKDARNRRRIAPAVQFFRVHPAYFHTYQSPEALAAERNALEVADGDDNVRLEYLNRLTTSIEQMAQHLVLEGTFKKTLRKILCATVIGAAGIVTFAWASNPPPKTPPANLENARLVGSNLRDADLRKVKLDNADLTEADLTGAQLDGASLSDVTWKDTVCPDGVNSDSAGGTCAGHLSRKDG
ncbi:pentapeptide repeat-containing protein [Streptomyces sp. NPDC006355]|uniref:pentapeptide repeat-containing protein n=1 Tax=Streptomyces sp. NPDC006355 TaxID=3156758 RepID=UPI0033A4EE10